MRVKLKPVSPAIVTDAHPPHAVATLTMQARLGNGVILVWTHDASCGPVLADLMHTLAGLPRWPPQIPPPVAGSNSSTPDSGTGGLYSVESRLAI